MQAQGTLQASVAVPSANLGKYRLIVRLAQGGMGDVYLAAYKGPGGFHKLVIIKELRSAFVEDESSLAMFLDEARLAARLSHQNVVQTNEVACEDSRHFMVMEYLQGKPFHQVLNRLILSGKLPWHLRVHVLCEALKGLHYAHELRDFDGTALSVVHRDFTPHNIFVTYEGVVKVLDFGIAKAVDSQETRAGVIKGKAAYMSPEQASGDTIDRRADIYSAGVIFWECITGRRMFPNLSEVQILLQVLKDAPPSPPREVNLAVPEELSDICMRALSRSREDRYETAEQMRLAIEEFLDRQNLRVTPAQIGDILQAAFREEREQLQNVVDAAMRDFRAETGGSSDIAIASEPITHSTIRPQMGRVPGIAQVQDLAPPSSGTGSTFQSHYAPEPEPAQLPAGLKPRFGRRIALGGVALAAVLGAYVVFGRTLSPSPPTAEQHVPHPAVPRVVAKAEPPKVAVSKADPATAGTGVAQAPASRDDKVQSPSAKSRPSQARSVSLSDNRRPPIAENSSLEKSDNDTSVTSETPAAATATAALRPSAPAPAPAPSVMAFSGEMTRPMMLSGRDPIYTAQAHDAKVEGTAVAKCTITTAGAVKNCRLLKSLPHMEKSILDALHSRRYTPVLWGGKPVAVSYVFNIRVVRPK